MNPWTKRLFLTALLTLPAAAWAASAAGGGGTCMLGALFGCGG